MWKLALVFITVLLLGVVFSEEIVEAVSKRVFISQIEDFGNREMSELPTVYTEEDASRNGDITLGALSEKELKRLDEFVENIEDKKGDSLRLLEFSASGTAKVVTNLQYNGTLIFYQNYRGKVDKTITEDFCRKVEKRDPITETAVTDCYKNKGFIRILK